MYICIPLLYLKFSKRNWQINIHIVLYLLHFEMVLSFFVSKVKLNKHYFGVFSKREIILITSTLFYFFIFFKKLKKCIYKYKVVFFLLLSY